MLAGVYSAEYVFQLTTSRRGRRGIAPMWKAHDSVSTHDLTKRSTGPALTPCQWQKSFNSRPHEEVDGIPYVDIAVTDMFQLTTSRRGRPAAFCHLRLF